jgi:DUF1365 family protein
MKIFHKRHTPEIYEFSHNMLYVLLNLNFLSSSKKNMFFSINKLNLFSVFWKDYGFKKFTDPRLYVESIFDEHDIDHSNADDIKLLTIPKALGWGFNPVSFWLCFDKNKSLKVVLAEVNNTFNERHGYLCFEKDMSPIKYTNIIRHPKVFHVSPFCKVKGQYNFRFDINEKNLKIDINYVDENKKLISTAITGNIVPLSNRNLLPHIFILPFLAFKVIFFIHFHALRLWIKKIPFVKKPKKINKNIT